MGNPCRHSSGVEQYTMSGLVLGLLERTTLPTGCMNDGQEDTKHPSTKIPCMTIKLKLLLVTILEHVPVDAVFYICVVDGNHLIYTSTPNEFCYCFGRAAGRVSERGKKPAVTKPFTENPVK